MNRAKFFDVIRAEFGTLLVNQVEGFERILNEAERRKVSLFKLAYILPTAWWETGRTMQPVREAFYLGAKAEAWRKKNLRYYPYYGRGLVQLTWLDNYKKAMAKYGVDFVNKPDLVMEWEFALAIMFDGMEDGWFTNKKLDDYIDSLDESDEEDMREFREARRIINGTDKALTIAKLGLVFEKALKAGSYGVTISVIHTEPAKPVETVKPIETKPVEQPKSFIVIIIEAILAMFGKGK